MYIHFFDLETVSLEVKVLRILPRTSHNSLLKSWSVLDKTVPGSGLQSLYVHALSVQPTIFLWG